MFPDINEGKSMSPINQMKSTNWLAQRLDLSVVTIERLRAQCSTDIPMHITIGSSIKYDEASVEAWIASRLHAAAELRKKGARHE